MSDFLFGLPTWVIVTAVLITCIGAFFCFVLCSAAAMGDKQITFAHADKVDQRMRELNHRDVQERVETRDFRAWDVDDV